MSTSDLIGNADSSESDDGDYVPSAEEGDSSDSDAETDSDYEERHVAAPRRMQVKCKKFASHKRGKGGISCHAKENSAQEGTSDVACSEDNAEQANESSDAAEKDKADSLWSDFMRDVDSVPRKRSAVPEAGEASTSGTTSQAAAVPEKKVRITQLLDFAGEVVKVDKEVAADSNEARLLEKREGTESTALAPKKKGGVAGVLSRLMNKKQKINTLEKSKLDWDNFKRTEGIAEDLKNHNKGKDGYLEKQAFLQRTDERQFEVEKGLRAKNRTTQRN